MNKLHKYNVRTTVMTAIIVVYTIVIVLIMGQHFYKIYKLASEPVEKSIENYKETVSNLPADSYYVESVVTDDNGEVLSITIKRKGAE